jgi:hypothetical protein
MLSTRWVPVSRRADSRQKKPVTYVNAHLADLALAAGDVVPINAAQATWTTDYPSHTAAQAAALAVRQGKDAARGDFLVLVLPDQTVAGERLEVADAADGGDVPPGPLDGEEALEQELVGDVRQHAANIDRRERGLEALPLTA